MNFLNDYIEFNECNEAHTNYHIWSALVSIASVVGRKVWIDFGHQWIYPHIYVVLIGPAGNRKSTAMHLAKKMMREVGGVNFAAQLESSQGLIKQMSESEVGFLHAGMPKSYSPLTICVGELKDFIGVSMQTMINFCIAVWDQDFYDYKLRNKETLVINNPSLNILACDTPEWVTSRLKDDIISGGFTRRVVFVYESEKRAEIPFPVVTSKQMAAWARCLEHLKSLSQITGQMMWSPAAKEYYIDWYVNKKKKETPKNTALLGYFDTKHVLLLKLSSLISMSQGFGLVLELPHIETAMAFLYEVEKNLHMVFQGLGRNELTGVTHKAVQLLEMNRGPMTQKNLAAALWSEAKGWEIDEVFKHLMRAGTIVAWNQGTVPSKKAMVCLPHYLPASVKQALERAAETTPDASASTPESLSPPVSPKDSANPPPESPPALQDPFASGIGPQGLVEE